MHRPRSLRALQPIEFQLLAPGEPLYMPVYHVLNLRQFLVVFGVAADRQIVAMCLHAARSDRKFDLTVSRLPFGRNFVGKVLAKLLKVF